MHLLFGVPFRSVRQGDTGRGTPFCRRGTRFSRGGGDSLQGGGGSWHALPALRSPGPQIESKARLELREAVPQKSRVAPPIPPHPLGIQQIDGLPGSRILSRTRKDKSKAERIDVEVRCARLTSEEPPGRRGLHEGLPRRKVR